MTKNYDRFIRPNFRVKPVDVTIDIFMNSFSAIKAGDMSYSININLRQRWNDPRLDYSHEDTGQGKFGKWDTGIKDALFRLDSDSRVALGQIVDA